MRRNKYGARPKVVDGIRFGSGLEAGRYLELKAAQDEGRISRLRLQTRWLLVPAARRPDGRLERAVHYVSDFDYLDPSGALVVEDTKSPPTRTADYVIKRKLMLREHGIAVIEIEAAK